MKNIVLINASPKMTNESSLSNYLIQNLAKGFENLSTRQSFINIRQSITKRTIGDDFAKIANADAVIIVFPLYYFCLPGILMRFLEDYQQFILTKKIFPNAQKIYAIINCGFPEPEINLEALRVIESFCKHIKVHFRCGVMIGGGGMLIEQKDAPFLKKTHRQLNEAFLKIITDIQRNDFGKIDNISIKVNFPRKLYLFMGGLGWTFLARKNGMKKRELYQKPYLVSNKA
jgi:hypothetical protein